MKALKYTLIKSSEQYIGYCNLLEKLVLEDIEANNDEIELLTLLIETWDKNYTSFNDADPITVLHYLMKEHQLKAVDIAQLLGITRGSVSKMLNYQKGISKESIRILSEYFKVSQELFNRPYNLQPLHSPTSKQASRNRQNNKAEFV
jgi:HTH-type transcriptional regulator/antitoxin HigA